MVTYVQIGKGPRMAINDTVRNIRFDFVKQMPEFKRLVPIYFYKTRTAKEWSGILLAERWKVKGGNIVNTFYWVGEYDYWSIWKHDGSMSKMNYGTVGHDNVVELIKKYKAQGFEF